MHTKKSFLYSIIISQWNLEITHDVTDHRCKLDSFRIIWVYQVKWGSVVA